MTAGATMLSAVDEAAIMAALATVPDPEIPVVSVVDLGIVRGVEKEPPAVLITPTYSGCPATLFIEQSVREALDTAGYVAVPVRTVLSPAWTTDWITDVGRERLRAYGIAPPPRGEGIGSLKVDLAVECPRCGSTDTREVSRFGSTPCKAQWQCRACLEPFDRFKCH
jgi:ring-1,2-phenylacetyl-CoA epoxidase subunit PaaD